MKAILRAIEVGGAIDEQRQLHLDTALPIAGPSRVRVIILFPDEPDMDESEWLRVARTNSAFDFLRGREEDIYGTTDGKPFNNYDRSKSCR